MIDVKTLDKDQIVFVLTGLWKKYVPEESTSEFEKFSLEGLQNLLDIVLTQDIDKRAEKFQKVSDSLVWDIDELKEFCAESQYFTVQVKEGVEHKIDEQELQDIENMLQEI